MLRSCEANRDWHLLAWKGTATYGMMGQKRFWDEGERLSKPEKKKPTLERLAAAIPWEKFRPLPESAFQQKRKSPVGHKEKKEEIKKSKVSQQWQDNPNRLRQKDLDAMCVKKNDVNYFGYKNSVSIDAVYDLIRRHVVTLPEGPCCPHCGSNVQCEIKHQSQPHRCRECPHKPMFTIRVGTVIQGMH